MKFINETLMRIIVKRKLGGSTICSSRAWIHLGKEPG
jgi:hypothetical protein